MKKTSKTGQVSIKITKPRLTINGFVVEKKKQASPSKVQQPQIMSNVNRDIAHQINNEEGFGEIPLQEIGDPDVMPAGEFGNEYQVDDNQYDMNGNQAAEYQEDDMVRGGGNLDED